MAEKKFVNNVNEKNLVLVRAQQAVIAHDYSTGARLYKQLLKDEPSNVDYLKEIGAIYVKSGEDEKAIPYYEQIITFYPHYIDAMTALGAIYRRLKRYEESIEILQRAQDEGRQVGDVNYNLGFTYREMGNYDDGIDAFNTVIHLNPSDVLAYNHLGSIYLAKKDYNKAISSFKRGLQIDQNHPILNYNLARCYGEAKMYTEAIRCYESALKAKPGWVDAIKDFSALLITCQKTKEASDLVKHSIELHPNDTKLLCTLGSIYLNQFDFDSAEKTFRRAKVVDDKDVQVLSGLAETLEKEDKPEEALDNVIEAMDIAPDNQDIKKQYAHTLLSAKEYDAAESNIREMYEQGGESDPQVLDLYGQYYICAGDEEKAEEYFKKINQVNRGYKNHYLSAANRYKQVGNSQKAESKAKDFVAHDLKNPAGYNMLGSIYEESGNLQGAVEAFDKSRNLRQPNVLADKQLSSLRSRLNIPLESAASQNEISETDFEEAEVIMDAQPVEITEDEAQEEEFDFGTMGDSVPMGEALIEEEKSFFDELDEAAEDANGLPDAEPDPEPEEEEPAVDDIDTSALNNPYKDLEDDSLSPFDDDLMKSLAGSGSNSKDEEEDIFGDSGLGSESSAGEGSGSGSGDSYGDMGDGPADSADSVDSSAFAESAMPEQYSKPAPMPQMQPDYNPYVMDSANRAMDAAYNAQRLAREQADEIEVLRQQVADLKSGIGFDDGVLNNLAAEAAAVESAIEPEVEPAVEAVAEEPIEEVIEEAPVVDEPLDENSIVEEATIEEVPSVEEEPVIEETSEEPFDVESFTDGYYRDIPEEEDEEEIKFLSVDEVLAWDMNNPGVAVETVEEPAVETVDEPVEEEKSSLLDSAKTLLPAIERILSDDEAAVENAQEVELFKKLLSLSEYLPEEAKQDFRAGNIRLKMEYIIAKMSGKPGLLKTAQSLKKSGVLGEYEPSVVPEGETVTNHDIRKVLKYVKKNLVGSLDDNNLASAMNNKIDAILEQIEIVESSAQIFN